jgi:hypothetical protein
MRSLTVLFTSLLLVAGLVISCGESKSVSGTWVCKEHYMSSMVDKIKLEFKDDGTVTMAPMGIKGTYELKGDVVLVKSKIFKDGLELKLDGNTLTATSSAGKVVYVKE